MYLKLIKGKLNDLNFTIKNIKPKDIRYYKNDHINILIYGYPFIPSTSSWLTTNDVYDFYNKDLLSFSKIIEGVYTILILDRVKKICFIITDRYGIYSLFYYKSSDYIIISDSIDEITALMDTIKLNLICVIEYLNFSFTYGNKMHVQDVYKFEGAAIYQINRLLVIREQIYWSYQMENSEEYKVSKGNLLNNFNNHIANAMNLEKRISLPLTGGLDTRTALSACIENKEILHCYTHGVKNSRDVVIAQRICKHFGIEHSLYELDEKWIQKIPTMLDKNCNIFNGMQPSLWSLHVKESLIKESKNGELFISGVMGNEIWRFSFDQRSVDRMTIEDIVLLIMNKSNYVDKEIEIYRDYNNAEIKKLLETTLKNEFIKYKTSADNKKLSYIFESFMYKNVCSNRISHVLKDVGKHFKVFAAFLQKDLLQQILSLISKNKSSGYIQKYIINENSKYLANVLLDIADRHHGATIGNNLGLKFRGGILLMFKYVFLAVNKIFRKLFRIEVIKIPYFTDYYNWLRNQHKIYLLNVLDYEKMITKDLFKKEGIEKVVERFLNGDNSLAQFIVRLISLEIWLKYISDGKVVVFDGNTNNVSSRNV